MKRIKFILGCGIAISNFFLAQDLFAICPCAYGSSDFATVSILEETPAEGRIVFSVQCYWTCEDGWDIGANDIPPTFLVSRPGECINEPYYYSYSTPGGTDFYKYRYCATYCGGSAHTCACACPPHCGCHNHSYHDYEAEFEHMWGSFEIKAQFKGEIIFEREFEFPENLPSSKLLNVTDIWFNDYTGQQTPANATFDVDESLIIEAIGEWDQDPPENWILGVIKSEETGDSLIVPLGLISGNYQNAFYRGIVGNGVLRQLYPDPEGYFGYFDREIMTIYGKQNGCDQIEDSAIDQAYVSIIRIYVDRIDFENNHPLCEETGGDPPTVLIEGPEWIRDNKNKPVCYTGGSNIWMNLHLISNFDPMHNLNVYLQGHAAVNGENWSTWPDQFIMTYGAYDAMDILSQQPLYSSLNRVDIPYSWSYNITSLRPPRSMNESGPHSIYTAYADPINTPYSVPTNTLGLELVCVEYAQGIITPHAILNEIMQGIYSEDQIIYNPSDLAYQYDDPYDLYRRNHGQCNCYTRFFLALSHSVGIPSNKLIIFSGSYVKKDLVADTVYWDEWKNTCRYGFPLYFPDLLWTNDITDPQGHDGGSHNAQCPPYWSFNFHAVGEFRENPTANYIAYDPVFNLSGIINTDYGDWLKFYYTDGQSHNEPPNDPPGLFRHASGTNIDSIYIGSAVYKRPHNFFHPSYPMPIAGKTVEKNNEPVESINLGKRNIGPWRVDGYLYSVSLDERLGSPWDIYGSSLSSGYNFRKKNIKNPGYYLIECGSGPGDNLDPKASGWIMNKCTSLLSDDMLSAAFTNFILRYDNVFDDSTRDEYFGRIQIDNHRLAIGGWFDKFMVVGIYKYFDNPDDFLDLARRYFQLAEIDKNRLEIIENGEPFYSYLDRENMFLLRGHGVFIVPADSTLTDAEKKDMKMVIELIKYYDEEFMP
jgi:hypothetical protein